ncbi:MAG: hypothetical protein A2Z04_06540 [Chloroflexi bacterium RBG_16_57_9]|nr:MAG: hypothetical protein A2Z04_06540 [Chloroflexi bacterium RBG_16_57_9]
MLVGRVALWVTRARVGAMVGVGVGVGETVSVGVGLEVQVEVGVGVRLGVSIEVEVGREVTVGVGVEPGQESSVQPVRLLNTRLIPMSAIRILIPSGRILRVIIVVISIGRQSHNQNFPTDGKDHG